jgi:hypothetical protein
LIKAKYQETLDYVREGKTVIEDQKQQINELKDQLKDAEDTLINNKDTIQALNGKLMEAQKFSFRALLSNKQTNAQITTAAHTNFGGNTLMSAAKEEPSFRESHLRSRSRSPHD